MSKRPNILFILTDQMRGTAMGCAGEKVVTPNLDAFAEQGVRFTRAVSNTPLCAPARATLLTGLHTMTHHLVNNGVMLRTDVTCLAECLNEVGYGCGYIGKWHIDTNDRSIFVPLGKRRRGFDDLWASCNCNHDYFEGYYYLDDDPQPHWVEGYEPAAQTDLAADYVRRKAVGDDPFCLLVSYGTPHNPLDQLPEKYTALYPPESIGLRPNTEGFLPDDPTSARKRLAGYYGHITALDEYFGRLLATLDDCGLTEDTIVIFTSDHGDLMYSHGPACRKHEPWSESVNIPFLARWPGHIPAGRVSNGLIGLVDVMPTLLAMCGARVPDGVEGLDLSGLIRGDESCSPDSAFINAPVVPHRWPFEAWRGVLTKRHTYARYADGLRLLFDDAADPHQLDNLAGRPKHVTLEARMENLLQEWLNRTDDPFEPSAAVERKYYTGSIDGIMPHYENEAIRQGKALRRRHRHA